jgi:uncharacterized protein
LEPLSWMPMQFIKNRLPLLVAVLISLWAGFAVQPAAAQELSPEHLSLARQYIDLTDHSGLYEATIVQMGVETYRTLLPQNPEIQAPLDEAIGTTIGTYRDRKGELFDQFARVYATVFSQEELGEIVAFYSSPVGQKLSKANADLNGAIQRVMGVFQANLRTEFFAKVRAELRAKGIDS